MELLVFGLICFFILLPVFVIIALKKANNANDRITTLHKLLDEQHAEIVTLKKFVEAYKQGLLPQTDMHPVLEQETQSQEAQSLEDVSLQCATIQEQTQEQISDLSHLSQETQQDQIDQDESVFISTARLGLQEEQAELTQDAQDEDKALSMPLLSCDSNDQMGGYVCSYEVEAEPEPEPEPIAQKEECSVSQDQEQTGEKTPGRSAKKPLENKEEKVSSPSIGDRVWGVIKTWFTTGNIPVKVGILALFIGLGALFKYLSDQGILCFSVPLRLACISALAIGALGFAWRIREKNRVFSLSLQGGAIGILLLTTFAAFRMGLVYESSILAFGISVFLVVLTGALAVVQNAMTLAIFSILAGFLAPVWLSSGRSNHEALFSYYAILNSGILAMACVRSWRHLNMLGFVFTFGVGAIWGQRSYHSGIFWSTEIFLLLFFAFYTLIPILYARVFSGEKKNIVDASLVFGTPLVAFSLQAWLLQDQQMLLAANAFGLGLLYMVLSKALRLKDKLKELSPAYMALGGGFLTLAVPLAFSAQITSCIYALEGAALVWWGLKQSRVSCEVSGIGLQGLSLLVFLLGFENINNLAVGDFLTNPMFWSQLIMAGAAFFTAACYYPNTFGQDQPSKLAVFVQKKWAPLCAVFYIAGLVYWCAAGVRDILVYIPIALEADLGIIFALLTAWLATEVNRKFDAYLLGKTTAFAMMLPIFFCILQLQSHATPLSSWGGLAWGGYFILGARSLYLLRNQQWQGREWVQFVWWVTWVAVSSLTLSLKVENLYVENSIFYASLALPSMIFLAISLWRPQVLRWPFGAKFDVLRVPFQLLLFVLMFGWWGGSTMLSAHNVLIPWLPILNPLEIMQLSLVGMLWWWLYQQKALRFVEPKPKVSLLAGMLFVFTSETIVRAVYHWGDNISCWGLHILLQTHVLSALSVAWGVLGGLLMQWGINKKEKNVQYISGALQMIAGVALLINMGLHYVFMTTQVKPILNIFWMNLALLGVMGLWTAWMFYRNERENGVHPPSGYAYSLYLWGILWLCVACIHEVLFYAHPSYQMAIFVGVIAIMSFLISWVHRQLPAKILACSISVSIGLVVFLSVKQYIECGHILNVAGCVAWGLFAALGWLSIKNLRHTPSNIAIITQLIWWPLWALVCSLECSRIFNTLLQLPVSNGWYQAALVSPWFGLFLAAQWRWGWLCQPLGHPMTWLYEHVMKVLVGVACMLWVIALFLPSQSAPLPWIPVLNPIDLLQLGFVLTMYFYIRQYAKYIGLSIPAKMLLRFSVCFILGSEITLRAARALVGWCEFNGDCVA